MNMPNSTLRMLVLHGPKHLVMPSKETIANFINILQNNNIPTEQELTNILHDFISRWNTANLIPSQFYKVITTNEHTGKRIIIFAYVPENQTEIPTEVQSVYKLYEVSPIFDILFEDIGLNIVS